ncbi:MULTISPECIES: hypothetical protein [Methylophaga]|uniref:hypothetical protein n=1 Tax=Methylophaga TaxID=40222 RepID=UPI000CDC0BD8|nr:hypothetical protein [Methylophaga nitratireducenticrescens]AUZ86117.1 hypothetical protein CDW43_15815 [Methylophaga nitratireducenticrescens]
MTQVLFNDDCIEVLTELDCMANSTEKADIAVISDCNGEPISEVPRDISKEDLKAVLLAVAPDLPREPDLEKLLPKLRDKGFKLN